MDPRDYPSSETVEEWEYNGRECKILWIQLGPDHGHWTGYATTTLDGSYIDYEDEIRVHGGITYGIDDEGFIGFDCGHAWDVCLYEERLYGVYSDRENVTEWTKGRVKDEVESLAHQLEQIERRLPHADLRDIGTGDE